MFTGFLILLTEFYFEYKEVFPQYCDLVETVRKGKKRRANTLGAIPKLKIYGNCEFNLFLCFYSVWKQMHKLPKLAKQIYIPAYSKTNLPIAEVSFQLSRPAFPLQEGRQKLDSNCLWTTNVLFIQDFKKVPIVNISWCLMIAKYRIYDRFFNGVTLDRELYQIWKEQRFNWMKSQSHSIFTRTRNTSF